MSDEAPETEGTAAEPTAKKQSWIEKKLARLAALEEENAALKEAAAAKDAVKEHFDSIDGYRDEHDRAHDQHREMIDEAKLRGIDPEEVIERNLDRTALRMEGAAGREWLKANRCKWINRTAREGLRVAEHEGRGFFIVRPGKHPVRPVAGIKREDTWLLGDLILMAEPMKYYERRRRDALQKMLEQGGMAREGTREELNKLIRDEAGQPHAQAGLTRSYRDNTWDELREGTPIQGPHASEIPAS